MSVFISVIFRFLLTVAVVAVLPQQLCASKDNELVPLYSVLNNYGYTQSECQALRSLLSLYDIDLDERFPQERAEEELVKKTQAACLRQGERFNTSEYNNNLSAQLLAQRSQLEEAALKVGLIKEIIPSPSILSSAYIALVPGALDLRICSRFQALVDQIISQRSAPSVIVAVTGYRALEQDEAPDALLTERTEAQLMAYRWKQYVEQHQELKDIPFIVSQAPLKLGQKRSNTFDTVAHLRLCHHELLEGNPQAVLYIEQPFARRFLGIFKTLPIELSASARRLEALAGDKLYMYGDEVARTIYFYAQQK